MLTLVLPSPAVCALGFNTLLTTDYSKKNSQRILLRNFEGICDHKTLGEKCFVFEGLRKRNFCKTNYLCIRWIQEGFTVEPSRNDAGAMFQ